MSAKKSASGSSKHDEPKYEYRDIVLAKIRGYPPWPAQIVDPKSVPDTVRKEQPGARKSFHCVQFFPVGDYAWLSPKDLSRLQKHEIEAYISEPHKKSGELLSGYRVALDPSTWEAGLVRNPSGNAEDDASEDDELDEDGAPERKKTAKKRKREPESSSEPKKGRGRPRKADIEVKQRGSASNGKKNSTKQSSKKGRKSEIESEDDKEEEAKNAPPTKKPKKSKDEDEMEAKFGNDPEAVKVKDWRHKLQKVFLSKMTPKPEDMPNVDKMFSQVETYDNMNIDYLSYSKIGKVMRHIAALSECPMDDQFHFRDRAQVLIDRWHEIMATSSNKQKLEPEISSVSLAEAEPLTAPPPTTQHETEAETNGTKAEDTQPEADVAATSSIAEPAETKLAPVASDVTMANGTGTTDPDADGEADADDVLQKKSGDILMAEA